MTPSPAMRRYLEMLHLGLRSASTVAQSNTIAACRAAGWIAATEPNCGYQITDAGRDALERAA